MRVTNQMTSNTLLLNLNKNNQTLNKLQLQMATGSKIQLPSEDPIVAALALKFRTNVSETVQYGSNVDQGKSWMDVTSTAISSVNKILERMKELSIGASSENYTQKDREDMLKEVGQLKNQLLSEANATYSGRYIFGGYKTGREVMFSKAVKDKYNIDQKFDRKDIETIKVAVPLYGSEVPKTEEVDRIKLPYTDVENLNFSYTDSLGNTININKSTALDTIKNNPPTSTPTVGNNQIGYDPATDTILTGPGVTIVNPPPTVIQVNSSDKDAYLVKDNEVKYVADTGEFLIGKSVVTSINGISEGSSTDKDAYVVGDNEIKYIKDTGEIILGKEASKVLKAANNIEVNYDKNGFKAGDLNPEQYFDCRKYGFKINDGKSTLGDSNVSNLTLTYTPPGATVPVVLSVAGGTIRPELSTPPPVVGDNDIVYLSDTGELLFGKNMETLLKGSTDVSVSYEKDGLTYTNATVESKYVKEENAIQYEFGVNNKMKINVEGSDVFTPELIQSIDDLLATVTGAALRTEDQIKSDLEKSMSTSDYAALIADKEALAAKIKDIQDGEEKIKRDVVTSRLDKMITKLEDYKNHASNVNSDLGARVNRLELVESRLGDDYVNYKELMTKNEGIEYEKVSIELLSQKAIYDSALSVGAKVIQKSLVDFI